MHRDHLHDYRIEHQPLNYASDTNLGYIPKGHMYENSEMEFTPQKVVPAHHTYSNPSFGENPLERDEILVRERQRRMPVMESGTMDGRMAYSGRMSEEHNQNVNRQVAHKMHPTLKMNEEGFMHNFRGVDFFAHQNENRGESVLREGLGSTNDEWTSVKSKASMQMQERFRLT